MMSDVFHEGELAVQAQAGVQHMASRVGRGIRSTLPPEWGEFLADQHLIAIASIDGAGAVWAAVLVSAPGFVHALDETTVQIDAQPIHGDPLEHNLSEDQPLGVLAINLRDRERMRLNGQVGRRVAGGIQLDLQQVFANCPKYIQSRQVDAALQTPNMPGEAMHSTALNAAQQGWITSADTFFIASSHAGTGDSSLDSSHRGGNPGFIKIIDSSEIVFPDYSGNRMFTTLGNLASDSHAGLLFMDFEGGNTLQLTGRAIIDWADPDKGDFPGAERLIHYQLDQIVQIQAAIPVRFALLERSRYNPA